ncbi:MAG: DUF4493 domain-containing protein [Pseudoflavonifractor sp.]|nr:DUF4493 domain-containing protein [Pseudoflavonifractor sp.]
MKKISIYFMASLLAAGVTACSERDEAMGGEGRVSLHTVVNSNVKVFSRAATAQELADGCTIWISSEKGLVRKYEGISNVPSEIWLVAGNYVAEAWTGDSVPASFDKRYFKGYQPFTVNGGSATTVNLKCKIANVVTSVNYGSSVDEVLKDYTMTVAHTKGELVFEGRDERKGYFMMPNGVTSLTWTVSGHKIDGSEYTKTGVIENVKRATEYKLDVIYNSTPIGEAGGGLLTVTVDESAVDVEDEIVITAAPEIAGVGFDIAEPLYCEAGLVGRQSLYVTAATALQSVTLTCDKAGLPAGGVDLMAMDDATRDALDAKGINAIYTYDGTRDVSNLKINFEETFTNSLGGDTYQFEVKAVDNFAKQRTATFILSTITPAVSANAVAPAAVWAKHATLTGKVLKEGVANVGFDYRKQGASTWSHAAATLSGDSFSATLTNLDGGTVYEYVATGDDFTSAEVKTFTTEAEAQVPNGGFEDWNTSTTAYLLYAPGGDMFWDSGNHGSTTLGASWNITVPSETVKHSGNYGADLMSKYVVMKFAAGNAFTGKYLKTDGTNGILGFGRPFSSRPTALKGYVKYKTGVINRGKQADLPANAGVTLKESNDIGVIYIAILDDQMEEWNGQKWPFIIKTNPKEQRLFDRNDSRVIGFGEITWDENTPGDDMIEFTIPIEYVREDVKASNILIVCSASYFGDYFVGCDSSELFVDDLQLVYE